MRSDDLLLLLQHRSVSPEQTALCVADGAMGTELFRHGIDLDACLEVVNVERPSLVESVHRTYRSAGAQMLFTNTFGANRHRLQRHGLQHRVRELNQAAVGLARRASDGGLVVGSPQHRWLMSLPISLSRG